MQIETNTRTELVEYTPAALAWLALEPEPSAWAEPCEVALLLGFKVLEVTNVRPLVVSSIVAAPLPPAAAAAVVVVFACYIHITKSI